MGDNIAVDWGAGSNMDPEGPLGVVHEGYKGALMGYDLGQKAAVRHALNGLDINDPKSIDAAMGGLVKAGAGEQASALQNLAWTRYLRSQAPAFQAHMASLGQQSSTPAVAPASTDPQSPVDHAVQTYQMAQGAADKLLAMPPTERPAAFTQIKQDMLSRGIPEQAIDAAGADLSDAGLKTLSQHYGDLLTHAQNPTGPDGQPTAMPAPHPSNNWSADLLGDPGLLAQISFMKGQGLDYSGLVDTAKAIQAPTIQQQAELNYKKPIAEAQAGVDVAKAWAMVPPEVQRAIGVEKGTLPYKVALATATADVAANHDLVSIPEIDKEGNPTGRTVTYRKDAVLGAGAGGKPVGTAQSPAEATGKGEDASLFMKNYEAQGNQQAITSARSMSTTAMAAAHMAQQYNPSNITPWKANMANTLNGLGIKIAADDANKLATYQNLLTQNVKNAIQIFPKNEVEFNAISSALPNMKTPGDAAALTLTALAAGKTMEAQQNQFRVDWAKANPGKYSERDYQAAWEQQPGAYQSIFASPLFQGLKFNGKPAVITDTQPHRDGHLYGVFMPGTPQHSTFLVR